MVYTALNQNTDLFDFGFTSEQDDQTYVIFVNIHHIIVFVIINYLRYKIPPLKAVTLLSMRCMLVTLDASHFDMSPLNDVNILNT